MHRCFVNFGVALHWKMRGEIIAGAEGAAPGRRAARSEADLIQNRPLMISSEAAAAEGSAIRAASCSSNGGIYEDKEETDHEYYVQEGMTRTSRMEEGDMKTSTSAMEGMLLKCMCSSVLLLCSITALLLLLPLLLPGPLPPPPLELLFLPLLILLFLLCLAFSPPSSPSSNLS